MFTKVILALIATALGGLAVSSAALADGETRTLNLICTITAEHS